MSDLEKIGPNGRVEVVVKSSIVASEVVEVPYFSGVHHYLGPTAVLQSRKVAYRRQLDDEQERLLETARELAESERLDLRIHDVSRESILRRFFRVVAGGRTFTPTLRVFNHAGVELAGRASGSTTTSFLQAQGGKRAHPY